MKFKHLPTGKLQDPLTGGKNWLVPALVTVTDPKHKVKDTADEGRYGYVVRLDNRELIDPEIVVDPPILDPKKKTPKRPAPKKRAKAARKGGKKSAAKRKGAKKKAAKKKARRR